VRRHRPHGVGDELGGARDVEGAELDRVDPRVCTTELLERRRERVRGVDLVVPVREDEADAAELGVSAEGVEPIERRGVGPLEVVEEQDDRLLGPRHGTEEALNHTPPAVLGLRRRALGGWRLLADDERRRARAA
jgi:hypothetical protein